MGITSLELLAGPELHLIVQERSRADEDRLRQAGIQASLDRSQTALGAGGGAEIQWHVPLGAGWTASVGARASLLALQVDEGDRAGIRAVAVLGGQVGVGYRF
jgi:hypothetical protein